MWDLRVVVFFSGPCPPSLEDTMWDLIADSVGAILVSTIGYVWMRYESRIPFTPRFLRAIEEEKRAGLVLDHETERGAT